MAAPEYEPTVQQADAAPEVQHYPEQVEIPAYIEQGGVQPVHQHPASLQDPQTGTVVAQNMTMQPPIVIPADPSTIHTWTKGSDTDSKTWVGFFWERVIKRALLLGKNVTTQ